MHQKTAAAPVGSIDRGSLASRPWKKGILATAAVLSLLGASLDAQAVALGAITVRSALGEPLRADIEIPQISSEEAASFKANVASPQAFRAAGVDYTQALSGAKVTLQRRPNGQAFLRVVGQRPVNEPFLGIVVEANWAKGSIVRDYTMLVDPPGRVAPAPVAITPSQVSAPPAAPVQAEQLTPPPPAPVAAVPSARREPAAGSAMPRRQAPTAAPAIAGEGAQVTVQRGDTAYGIASSHAAEGVSLDQMLVAMLRANPQAFIGGNVNRMRAGVVLSLPSAEQAAATPRKAARRAVLAQTRDFNAFRRGLAQRSGATRMASAASGSAAGSVQPQVQESRPAAASPDKLTISRGGSASGTEAKVAQSRQAQEQSERVAELNKNISELSRLQAASGTTPAASAATPAINLPVGAPAASEPAPASAAALAASAAAAAASGSADAASASAEAVASAASDAASSASEAASAAASAVASAPPKPRVAPPPPAPIEEPSFLDSLMENPLIPAGVVALLALLGGYGVYRSRQAKKKAAPLDSGFVESRLQPDSFFGASGGQRVNTRDSGTTASGSSSMAYSPSQLDAAGDVDPVAEADVYLAYGRDMQAEEILKEALRTQPGRVAVHRKLAEIYAKRRDARALEALATEAYDVTHGEGPDWLAITALGAELEPSNPLYQPGGAPVARTSPVPARHSFGADTEPQTAQLLDKKGPTSSGVPLDLNLDLNDAPVRASSPAPAPASAATASQPSVAAASAGVASAMAEFAAQTQAPTLTPAPAHPSVAAPVPPAATPGASDAHAPLDFDLDLDFSPPSEMDASKTPAAADAAAGGDTKSGNSGMIDFDMNALSVDPDSRSGSDIKTEQPEDADEDPLGTKLALAQEFHAIGDTEGARTLAKEVVAEASGAMRVRAERFLAELG